MLQGDIAQAVRELLAQTAIDKNIDLLEHEAIVDHVHLLLRAADKTALSREMNDLKGVSARRIFQRFPELKLDAHTNAFWQARYGHKVVPDSAEPTIRKYIKTQWERLEDYDR
jgi:putative transposase